jgi:hypothetical protein
MYDCSPEHSAWQGSVCERDVGGSVGIRVDVIGVGVCVSGRVRRAFIRVILIPAAPSATGCLGASAGGSRSFSPLQATPVGRPARPGSRSLSGCTISGGVRGRHVILRCERLMLARRGSRWVDDEGCFRGNARGSPGIRVLVWDHVPAGWANCCIVCSGC